jgi:UDP-glucose 4-epimerase
VTDGDGALSALSGATVLVTGASGFIGSRLSGRLVRRGAEVHAAFRGVCNGVARGVPGDLDGGISWWQADFAEEADTRRVLRSVRPDVVFHLASRVTGARRVEEVLPTLRANLVSTVNLLSVALEEGCGRVVLTGSMEEPDAADAEAAPSSPYAAAKWAGSAYARLFHDLWGQAVSVLRVFMVYGPGRQDPARLVPHVVASLLSGEAPRLTSGERLIDWVYVDDVVSALEAAATAPGAAGGRPIPIGSGSLVSIRDLVMELAGLVDPDIAPVFGAVPDRPREQVRVADTEPALRLLGWRAQTALREGLMKTVEWYREQAEQGE